VSAWPTIPALLALLLILAEYTGRLSSRTPRTPNWSGRWWIAALVGSYVAVLSMAWYAACHEYPMNAWRATMPLPVVDKDGVEIEHGNLVAVAMLALATLQSYALLGLYRAKPRYRAVWLGCAAMLLLSCSAPVLTSFDLYGYVQYATLGLKAYQPSSLPFVGEYHIFDLWHDRPITAPYGPLWLVVAPLVTSALPTLLSKMLALRVLSALLFLALLAGLHALGTPARIRNVAALNPGLMLQFVANAHNDLLPIVLIVWGAVLVRTRTPLAFGLIAAAGLVKLPYMILGLPILAAAGRRWSTLAGIALTIMAVVGLSWATGGSGYLAALTAHVHEYPQDLAQHVAALAALVLILLATANRRRIRAAVWAIPMLSAALYPWYFVWGLPYALARRRALGYLLVGFPFVTVLTGLSLFLRVWQLSIVLPLVVIGSLAFGRTSQTPRAGASVKRMLAVEGGNEGASDS
jgi:hypothetical protein